MTRPMLLRGGTIVAVSPDHPGEFVGEILIVGERIADIGPKLDVSDEACQVIDIPGSIVMPGFVDTHRHTWQAPLRYAGTDWTIAHYAEAMFRRFGPNYTPDDMYVALKLGIAEAIEAGVTQLLDWNHNLLSPDHADEAVRAHRESGARMILGYGQSSRDWAALADRADHKSVTPPSEDIRRLRERYYSSGSQLTTLAMAARGPELSTLDVVRQVWRQAEELDLRLSIHLGNGTWARIRPVEILKKNGLLQSNITYIHCNGIADDEIQMIADSGGTVSCSVEEEMHMGHGHPAVERLLRAGLRPSFSIDTCSNVSGSMFALMKSALSVVRGDANDRRLASGSDPLSLDLSVRDVIEFATLQGAKANGLDAISGSLDKGKQADIVVISCNTASMMPLNYAAGAIVMGAHQGNVDTVIVGGKILKRNGRLVDIDLDRLRSDVERCRDRLYQIGGAKKGSWMPELTGAGAVGAVAAAADHEHGPSCGCH